MARILIIDDDENVTTLLTKHLTDEGYEVIATTHPDEGLNKAQQVSFDLILLDVMLPDQTGFQLCSRLRKLSYTQKTPIFMMSGGAQSIDHRKMGSGMGANEYIFKPFDLLKVSDLVGRYIGNKRKNPPLTPVKHPDAAPVSTPPLAPAVADDFSALSAALKALNASQEKTSEETKRPEPELPKTPEPLEIDIPAPATQEPEKLKDFMDHMRELELTETFEMAEPTPQTPEPIASPELQETPTTPSILPFTPQPSEAEERFVAFGLDLIAITSQLIHTPTEKYLADQLLRCGLSAGAQHHASQTAESPSEHRALLKGALKDIREAGYWLMLIRQAGLLDITAKKDLEKTCQELTAQLVAQLHDQK
jgi:four helix bundle protein